MTRQRTSSMDLAVSMIWSKLPSTSRKTVLLLHDLCSYLRTTTDMEHSPIEELIIRKEEDGVQHEFLLIMLHKPSGGEFWMRLERNRPVGTFVRLISGFLEANDIVSALINDQIITDCTLLPGNSFQGCQFFARQGQECREVEGHLS